MKKLVIVVLCAVMAFSLTACNGLTSFNNFKTAFFTGDERVVESTIRIGVYEPLSGEYKDKARGEINGIELAHKLNPKIYGLNVELIYADNKSDMYTGETAIVNLLERKPVLVLGSYGEVLTLVASKYLQEAKTPGITISALNPLITINNEYFFRATYSEEKQGPALADFAYTSQGREKIAIIKVGSDDSVTEEISTFKERIAEIASDTTIVADINLIQNQTDYTEVFDRLRIKGATAVFLALPPEAAKTFITQACEYGLRYILFMGTRAWDTESMIQYATENGNYNIAFCSAESHGDAAIEEEFKKAYIEEYGVEPTGAASVGYDAYMLAIKAIQAAYDDTKWREIPTGTAVRDELLAVKGYNGVSGILAYDGSNEATKTITIHRYLGYSMEQYTEDVANLAAQLEVATDTDIEEGEAE